MILLNVERTLVQTPMVERVSVLADRLSGPLGAAVSVAANLKGVPIFVQSDGTTPLRVLEGVAFALHATLSKNESGYALRREKADEATLTERHQEANRARINAALVVWDGHLKASGRVSIAKAVQVATEAVNRNIERTNDPKFTGDPYGSRPGYPGELRPAGRLLRALIERIGVDGLSRLAPDGVRYLSDRPNAVEEMLPDIGPLLAKYEAEQALFAQESATAQPFGTPARVILRLQPFGIDIDLFDARGKRIDGEGVNWTYTANAWARPRLVSGTDHPIALREASRRTLDWYKTPSPTDLDMGPEGPVLNPDRVDPLDFAVRDAMASVSDEGDAKLRIAVLSDELLDLIARADLTTAAWRGELAHAGFEHVVQGDVAVWRPKDLAATEATLTDRTALGHQLRQLPQFGGISVVWLAETQLRLHGRLARPLAQGLLSRLSNRPFPNFCVSNGEDSDMLAITGALLQRRPPRATEWRGSLLDPTLRRLVRDRLELGPRLDRDGAESSDLQASPSRLLASEGFAKGVIPISLSSAEVIDFGNDVESARPEAKPLRSGQPPASFVRAPSKEAIDALEPRPRQRMVKEFERIFLASRYRIGQRNDYAWTLDLAPSVQLQCRVSDAFSTATGVPLKDLPPAYREPILAGLQTALTRLREIVPPTSPDS